jgi:hypothetical protein
LQSAGQSYGAGGYHYGRALVKPKNEGEFDKNHNMFSYIDPKHAAKESEREAKLKARPKGLN